MDSLIGVAFSDLLKIGFWGLDTELLKLGQTEKHQGFSRVKRSQEKLVPTREIKKAPDPTRPDPTRPVP